MTVLYYLYEVPREVRLIEIESRMVTVRGLGWRELFSGYRSRVSGFFERLRVLEIGCASV